MDDVCAVGIGVHSGESIEMHLWPAPANTGIVFRRVDLPGSPEVPALSKYVSSTQMSTTIANGNASVATVEHLLSALYGLGIDNLYIDLSSYEVPIMDGSAAPFIFILQTAGICEQNAPKSFLRIKREVSFSSDDKYIIARPYNGFKVDCRIDFDHPSFNADNQHVTIDFSSACYHKEVARARTFGFLADYEEVKKRNLARGTNYDNTIVMDDYRVLNKEGTRYDNEPLKHKVLDLLGDLYLLGHCIIGEIEAFKSGHALNNQFLVELLQEKEAYEIVVFDDEESYKDLSLPVMVDAIAWTEA
jgi:UDP-3-O-[3-hydroxymyristoyl] N-acetylglucosamine deacetylase